MYRVSDYIFDFLADVNVGHVFLVPGGGAMHLVDAVGLNNRIQYVATHHEQAASISAEAYSRITGKLGCALVTTGPGVTNAATGVTGAWIDSVPMFVISGQVKRADLMAENFDRGAKVDLSDEDRALLDDLGYAGGEDPE